MNERTKQQNEALFGPSARSEYDPGDVLRYTDGDELAEGTVLFSRDAGPVREGGPVLGSGHIVDSGKGWPRYVPFKKVVG